MRTVWCIVILSALSVSSCSTVKNAVQQLPSGTSNGISQPKPASDATSQAVDEYLTWLDSFVDTRTEAIFAVEQDARVKARNAVLTAQANPAPSPSAISPQQVMGALNDVNASQKPLIDVYTQQYNAFRQRTPPPECAMLANQYATYLYKQLNSVLAMQAEMAKLTKMMSTPEGAQPPSETAVNPSIDDSGTEEMMKANNELAKLYKKYPALTTTRFVLK